MDQVDVVRHQVLVEGRSQRSVAREHGVSRNTVRKYMDQSERRRRWVTERVAPRLEELLVTWSGRTTAKQLVTATRLHRQLLEEGYEVGITTVRSYVREWQRRRRETFMPLVHRAGECGQVDFFEVTVEEDGVAHRVWKLLLHLCLTRAVRSCGYTTVATRWRSSTAMCGRSRTSAACRCGWSTTI